jgi:hypothetical protein
MANVGETRKIMTKPLPEILDEIEDSIRLADEAAKDAREAAVEARKAGEKAAGEARKAGEQAAMEARKSGEVAIEQVTLAINQRIDKVEQVANNALHLAELLKSALTEAVLAADRTISGKSPEVKVTPKK